MNKNEKYKSNMEGIEISTSKFDILYPSILFKAYVWMCYIRL